MLNDVGGTRSYGPLLRTPHTLARTTPCRTTLFPTCRSLPAPATRDGGTPAVHLKTAVPLDLGVHRFHEPYRCRRGPSRGCQTWHAWLPSSTHAASTHMMATAVLPSCGGCRGLRATPMPPDSPRFHGTQESCRVQQA
jgi:hypothetical protein